jgi:hypothetical protein
VNVREVQSGDSLHVICEASWYNPSIPGVLCKGGLYDLSGVSCQNNIANPIFYAVLGCVIVLSGWLNKVGTYMPFKGFSCFAVVGVSLLFPPPNDHL